jgi:hypothetical protein
MASRINPSLPNFGNPTTQSVRNNFQIAVDEITDLQEQASRAINRDGDTMLGTLTLAHDPQLGLQAATRRWVIGQLGSSVNTLIFVGDYDAARDVVLSSNFQPLFTIGDPLPPASEVTSQRYFTVSTTSAIGIGNQPPSGVPGGSWLISNGEEWIVFLSGAPGVTADGVVVSPSILGLPGNTVHEALVSVTQNFLPLTGGELSNGLSFGSIAVDSTSNLTRHISLWGGTYGFSITAARLNYVAHGDAAHVFMIDDLDIATFRLDGLRIGSVFLDRDPVNTNEATTKQYVDTLFSSGSFLPLTGGVINGTLGIGNNIPSGAVNTALRVNRFVIHDLVPEFNSVWDSYNCYQRSDSHWNTIRTGASGVFGFLSAAEGIFQWFIAPIANAGAEASWTSPAMSLTRDWLRVDNIDVPGVIQGRGAVESPNIAAFSSDGGWIGSVIRIGANWSWHWAFQTDVDGNLNIGRWDIGSRFTLFQEGRIQIQGPIIAFGSGDGGPFIGSWAATHGNAGFWNSQNTIWFGNASGIGGPEVSRASLDGAGNLTINGGMNASGGGISAAHDMQSNNLYLRSLGVGYWTWGGHLIGFQWTGALHAFADGVHIGDAISDQRRKRNVQSTTEDVLDILSKVEVYSYEHIDPIDTAFSRDYEVGFIAQQLKEVMPDAVNDPPASVEYKTEDGSIAMTPDGMYTVRHLPLLARCVKAIQILTERVTMLEARAT